VIVEPPKRLGYNLKRFMANYPDAQELPATTIWGEAVEGVQVRLRAEKTVWAHDETPTFTASIRNQGEFEVHGMPGKREIFELEFDGRWYRDMARVRKRPLVLAPGQEKSGIAVSLGFSWWRKEEPNSPEILPGKHTVRVAFNGTLGNPRDAEGTKAVRVVSNPVEITIEPALPGSKVSIEEALADPDFAFAVVCEAYIVPQGAFVEPAGVANERQGFSLVESLSAEAPTADAFNVRYKWIQNPVPLERSIAKGERVI